MNMEENSNKFLIDESLQPMYAIDTNSDYNKLKRYCNKQKFDFYEMGEYIIIRTLNHMWGVKAAPLKENKSPYMLFHLNHKKAGSSSWHRQGKKTLYTPNKIMRCISRHEEQLFGIKIGGVKSA